MLPLRIFISSPMDVNSERSVVRRVIERLAIQYAYHFRVELIMSELEPILATQTPQAGIVPPSTTDIVVALLSKATKSVGRPGRNGSSSTRFAPTRSRGAPICWSTARQ
jgi:hypothetical protein